MTQLIINNEIYEAISSSALYENEFQRIVVQRASILYPKYIVVPFNKTVYSNFNSAKADLALIDAYYRWWWVVEIEMIHHSLYQHVLPQVETLSNAKYGRDVVEYLISKNDSLNHLLLIDMMKGVQPRMLVVVNADAQEWISPLSRYNAILQIVQVFRSDKNHHVVRVNGNNPTTIYSEIISDCYPDPSIPRLIVIESPAGLGILPGEKIGIEYEGGMCEWERIDSKDKVWLNPIKRNPLQPNQWYKIIQDDNGVFHFKTITRRRI